MNSDIDRIIDGLSEAQRDAMRSLCPWDIDRLPAGVAACFARIHGEGSLRTFGPCLATPGKTAGRAR